MSDDDLEPLRAALAPPPVEPPEQSIAALHAAVGRRFDGAPRPSWWKSKIPAGAAVFATVISGSATAYAVSGAALPEPLRAAMHGVGLPVDSVDVARTKNAESHLKSALEDRNAKTVQDEATDLKSALSKLNRHDWKQLAPQANSLLQQAGQTTKPPSSESSGSGRNGEPSPQPSPTTTTTTVRTDGGDNGGQATTTTTTVQASGHDGDSATTTTVPSGSGGTDGGGGGGTDGGGGGSTTDGDGTITPSG